MDAFFTASSAHDKQGLERTLHLTWRICPSAQWNSFTSMDPLSCNHHQNHVLWRIFRKICVLVTCRFWNLLINKVKAWSFPYLYRMKRGLQKASFPPPPPTVHLHSAQTGSSPPLSPGSSFWWTAAGTRIHPLLSDQLLKSLIFSCCCPICLFWSHPPGRTANTAGVPLPESRPGQISSAINNMFSDRLMQSHNCCCTRLVQKHSPGKKTLLVNRVQLPATEGSYITEFFQVHIKFYLQHCSVLALPQE